MSSDSSRAHDRAIAEGADVYRQRQAIGRCIVTFIRHRPHERQRAASQSDRALVADELPVPQSRGVLPGANASLRGLACERIEAAEVGVHPLRADAPERYLQITAMQAAATHSNGGAVLYGETLSE